ncbi:unnamed protein product [Durusdinium trenchii]|uniref:Secreted protein n=1 Tax=Durusdinium trenchii TaxID=1381693 RepID=A0ABP0Q125_9DINO
MQLLALLAGPEVVGRQASSGGLFEAEAPDAPRRATHNAVDTGGRTAPEECRFRRSRGASVRADRSVEASDEWWLCPQ